MRHSIKLQEFIEIAKSVFLEAGIEEMERHEYRPSTSRISIMTGLHRKDIDRLQGDSPKARSADVLTRVVGQWRYDRRFVDSRKRPRPLSFTGKEGEFAELVYSVSREINPYTVLFELERLGLVERNESQLYLKTREYVPAGDVEESFRLAASDIRDLLQAVHENCLDSPSVPNVHLTTQFDNVAVEDVPKLRKWMLEQAAKLHERARTHLSRSDRDIHPKKKPMPAGARVVFGTFTLTEVPAPADNEAEREDET